MTAWHIESAGPGALIIRFGNKIDPSLAPIIRAAGERLERMPAFATEIRDLIPCYTSMMVSYHPVHNSFASLSVKIRQQLSGLTSGVQSMGQLVEIPVWYDPEVGPDLAHVAEQHGIAIDEVVRRHSQCDYQVYAIGFAPGFAYLGEVDEGLATPRLATPRPRIAAGSVALADRQTAIYPIATPGGWNILGRTTIKLFDPEGTSLCPLVVGDRVRFMPISREQFLAAGGLT